MADIETLNKLLSKQKPKPKNPLLEIIVKLDSIELRIIGMSQVIKTKHSNTYSFTVSFKEFYGFVRGEPNQDFIAEISTGSIILEMRKFYSSSIEFHHPETLSSINLQLNYRRLNFFHLMGFHTVFFQN